LIAAAAAYGSYYWVVGRFLETTDDAYVQADSTIVAPKVSYEYPTRGAAMKAARRALLRILVQYSK